MLFRELTTGVKPLIITYKHMVIQGVDDMDAEKIVTEDGGEVKTGEFVRYGNDNKFFAIVDKDLYMKTEKGKYRLIKKSFREEIERLI